jgi:hypothetical protein
MGEEGNVEWILERELRQQSPNSDDDVVWREKG